MGSFLDDLAARIRGLPEGDDRSVFVMPSFSVDCGYEERIRASTTSAVKVIRPEELATLLNDCESADYLLVLDAGRWPAWNFDLRSLMRGYSAYRAASHLIAVGVDGERLRERVRRDGNGRVKCVQRLYNGVTWPQVASVGVFVSIVPAWTIGGTQFSSLKQLRSALSAKGVLSRDVPVAVDVGEMTKAEAVLALNVSKVEQAFRRPSPSGFAAQQANFLVGRNCRIDPSARFVGPVVLHDRVTVGAGAIVVGPTVVGSGSEIHAGAVIAQSVLAPATVVESGTTLRQCVASGCCSGPASVVVPVPEPAQLTPAGVRRHRQPNRNGAAPTTARRGRRRIHFAVKRAVDIVLSLAGLLVLSPLMTAVAALIKLGSPGPVLFVHRRESKGGKEFGCLKFRTMTADAHLQQPALYERNQVDGPQFKLRHDPRVTRFGQWMRATNIDELPQLINVLLGHMSLVGPRPSPFRENQICVPWRRARLSVRPGITGLWQICRSGDRTQGDFHQWIFYDIAYVRHFSIVLDLKILFATVLTRGGQWSVPMSWLVRSAGGHPGRTRQTLAA